MTTPISPTLSAGDSGPVPSRPATELPFDPFAVDDMSDAEMDSLAHGAIALDAEGRILRYNLAEASLARLDRHSVLGRRFFDEVAPCTRTPEFEGAFKEMVAQGTERVERFAYLFDFKFGAQTCDVEMVKAKNARRWYVFVTRREFLDAREGLDEGWAAPLQDELDAAESANGVLRNASEQRILRLDVDFLSTLLATAREQQPVEWPRLCHAWGTRWGRRIAVGLEMQSVARHGGSLLDLPFARTVDILREHLAAAGWGRLGVDTSQVSQGILVVRLERSIVAEIVESGRERDAAMGAPLLEGVLGALFTFLAKKQLTAIALSAATPSTSQFVLISHKLRSLAVSAVASDQAGSASELLQLIAQAKVEVAS